MVRFLALMLGVCAAQGAAAQSGAPTEWVLTEVNGAAAAYSASLVIDGASMSGKAPCNRFRAEILGTPPQISLGPIAATRMACDAMAEEGAYFEALAAVTQMLVDGGTLTLSGAGHSLVYGVQAKVTFCPRQVRCKSCAGSLGLRSGASIWGWGSDGNRSGRVGVNFPRA